MGEGGGRLCPARLGRRAGPDPVGLHTAAAAAGVLALLHMLLLAFPKSVTIGDAALWANFVGLLASDALAATVVRVRRPRHTQTRGRGWP